MFVKIVVEGNPPSCFLDHNSKSPKINLANACVTDAISRIFITISIKVEYSSLIGISLKTKNNENKKDHSTT